MEIMKLFEAKRKKLWDAKTPTIALFGDSITQGCFEFYRKNEREFATVFDKNHSYGAYLSKALSELFPSVPVNFVNAGVSGGDAPNGLKRLERDVLSHNPDLTVVSFGLNDSFNGLDGIETYTAALSGIFSRLCGSGEVIFMTQNMMNTYISPHITDDVIKKTAEKAMGLQNGGVVDKYFESAKKTAAEYGVRVCDVYEKWKKLAENGVDTTEILANYINHPTRGMNRLFAYSILETMMA